MPQEHDDIWERLKARLAVMECSHDPVATSIVLCRECLPQAVSDAARGRAHTEGNRNPHAQSLGKLGGSVSSDAKTAAARLNAKKGGWPKGKPRKPKP
jgi:hypothetical protein